MSINQRNVTRNQSTADYSVERLFIFGNNFQEATFKNNTGSDLELKQGILVRRNPNNPAEIIPATNDETLKQIIGIVKFDGSITIEDGETADINYGLNGDIDENFLALPEGVDLNTVLTGGTNPPQKTLKDVLHALGFNLNGSYQNTQYDN